MYNPMTWWAMDKTTKRADIFRRQYQGGSVRFEKVPPHSPTTTTDDKQTMHTKSKSLQLLRQQHTSQRLGYSGCLLKT